MALDKFDKPPIYIEFYFLDKVLILHPYHITSIILGWLNLVVKGSERRGVLGVLHSGDECK